MGYSSDCPPPPTLPPKPYLLMEAHSSTTVISNLNTKPRRRIITEVQKRYSAIYCLIFLNCYLSEYATCVKPVDDATVTGRTSSNFRIISTINFLIQYNQ